MKTRIKFDCFYLALIIIFTALFYFLPKVYPSNHFSNNIFNLIGFISILSGMIVRMSARGHKKARSALSKSLVTSGLYQLVRNPMYLGSFLVGAGFIFITCPWWIIFIFALLFYSRFNIQMQKEEKFLSGIFAEEYTRYCQNTPRIFPTINSFKRLKIKEAFNLSEMIDTNETRGIFIWPALAIFLASVKEIIIFGKIDFISTFLIFLLGVIIFVLGFSILYIKKI